MISPFEKVFLLDFGAHYSDLYSMSNRVIQVTKVYIILYHNFYAVKG